jgi:hypothetical protein
MGVSQREFWNGPPAELRELFTLTNARGARARCVLWSHQFGWELRLTVNNSLIRSQVCRQADHATSAADEWERIMRSDAWTDPEGSASNPAPEI